MDLRGNPRFMGQMRFPGGVGNNISPRMHQHQGVIPNGSPFLQNQSPNNPVLAQMSPSLRLPMGCHPTGPPPPTMRLFSPVGNVPITGPGQPVQPLWGSGAIAGMQRPNPMTARGQMMPGNMNIGNVSSLNFMGAAPNVPSQHDQLAFNPTAINLQVPQQGGMGFMNGGQIRSPVFQNMNQAPFGIAGNMGPGQNQPNQNCQNVDSKGADKRNLQSSLRSQNYRDRGRRDHDRGQGQERRHGSNGRHNRDSERSQRSDRNSNDRGGFRSMASDRSSEKQGAIHARDRDSTESRKSRRESFGRTDSRRGGNSRPRDSPKDDNTQKNDTRGYGSRRENSRGNIRRDNNSRSSGTRGDNVNESPRGGGRRENRPYGNRENEDETRGTKRRNNEESYSSDSKRKRTLSPELMTSKPEEGLAGEEPSDEETESQDQSEAVEPNDVTPPAWIRCSPADLYFIRNTESGCVESTKRMTDLEAKFDQELLQRAKLIKEAQPKVEVPPPLPVHSHVHHHHHSDSDSSSSSSSSSGSDSDENEDEDNKWMEELNRKKNHPYRLHEELWYNDPGEMNDGPVCRCSLKSRRTGIRHDKYPGEEASDRCNPVSSNTNLLYHYVITMSPPTNFLTRSPTIIEHDNHEYIFEGFSLFSHYKLENIPVCKVIRFNISYTIHFFEETVPENYSIRSMDLFSQFLFTEILELVDLDWKGPGDDNSCPRFHLMPRFARSLPENGKEILSMNEVLLYLLRCSKPLLEETELAQILKSDQHDWENFLDEIRGMVVTYPGMKPSSLRIDQLDRQQSETDVITYPLIIHFGIRPAQLSYAGDPYYQKTWKQYVKFKHLLNSKPKVTFSDKQKLEQKESYLQELRTKSTMKREVTVEISSEGFLRTGIKSDITQHAMLIPVLLGHLRFHQCLSVLEKTLDYRFNDRSLLQLALTHTSYKVNYGTNPDHARNSLSNCGRRQLEYGDRKIHYAHTRKRGINILLNIMSRMGNKEELSSEIPHNERLEFLGDAVVEFITSVHLFHMFPWLEEGGLTTYRAAIVQNQQLAVLAKKLTLQNFMLYAHGPDLCHESDLKHAMANCFEALMGALFIDNGIELAGRIYCQTLFDDDRLVKTWRELALHPLQEEEPNGDRQWLESSPALQKLLNFEEATGITFNHIRLLAKAFTLRSVGYNNLTLGHNQRLEFLGDTVLQLVASQFLFRHFPDHHEGHLSLLRSSLVNNRTQSIVCDDLNMSEYAIFAETRGEKLYMKTKEKADLLEAFIGALFVDKGIEYCEVFCNVCFFPRLKDFIMNQDWNDPKSQLQQCCLTLRELDGGEPDIPLYKMIEAFGPTNTRQYTVAVYFRDERLAKGMGHSIQQAEMAAARNALKERSELFPILAHQKRFLEKKQKRRKHGRKQGGGERSGGERGSSSAYSPSPSKSADSKRRQGGRTR
ncbi:ribonuclease 3-like [Mizuhopecten yessoensis]|uniref:ribonuclease 3-like n=1 Tax=Mizuhopecten yessoensis TaxID=6573 RepID=UPI000B4596A2|nr:ribonuclease 3-like [Mizuhopecten yessoensis]